MKKLIRNNGEKCSSHTSLREPKESTYIKDSFFLQKRRLIYSMILIGLIASISFFTSVSFFTNTVSDLSANNKVATTSPNTRDPPEIAINGRSIASKDVFSQNAKKEIKSSIKYRNPFSPLQVYPSPCIDSAHTSGQWEYNASKRPEYPALGTILGCCQRGLEKRIDAMKRQIRERDRVSTGIPTYLHTQAPLPSPIRPEIQYQWKTDKCELVPWSEELFCKSLRGRDIMLAGDSLNDHWHASLYYLLGGRQDIYSEEGTSRSKRRCPKHNICAKYTDDKKPLKLFFLTNQFLQEERYVNRNYNWWKYINQYGILVLNSGSWMRNPKDDRINVNDDQYFTHMRNALQLVQRQKYNGTVIWRTTYQGHPYCWKYTKPLTKELNYDDFSTVPHYNYYRWKAIPKRNQFATKLWRDAGAHILDVSRITNLMPLGHLGQNHPKFESHNATDCLHYCSPGPVYETWSMLLMNLLAGNLVD
eukprot:Tbor_TRINITY_DN5712_c0_g4::TRINITY_DN5712_c0_g4_i1::g.19947::m.19947